MSQTKRNNSGGGCGSTPLVLIFLLLGGGWWLAGQFNWQALLPKFWPDNLPWVGEIGSSPDIKPPLKNSIETKEQTSIPNDSPHLETTHSSPKIEIPLKNSIDRKEQASIRGIYLSRYQATNNANEQKIRQRVRDYRDWGFNTIIHGVWGNGCTMYKSKVTAKYVGYDSCPNQFQEQWIEWLIDEAEKQGMEIHAYFEKGIKIDENSPLFDIAVEQRWIVAGVDRTYQNVDHYVLDISIPEVAALLTDVLVEFVQKYPTIDAAHWDDYLGYHAELPGNVDRGKKLTEFVQKMITAMKQTNSNVSFDITHHNPYWAKTHFAADWQRWNIDRAFIQAYAEDNFEDEMQYVHQHDGIAITEKQFVHLPVLLSDKEVGNILVFPLSGESEAVAVAYSQLITKLKQQREN